MGDVIYAIIDNYICIDYLGLFQYKWSKHDNNFENTKFNNVSGLGIPEILMNIISCYGCSKSSISTVISTIHGDLVPY